MPKVCFLSGGGGERFESIFRQHWLPTLDLALDPGGFGAGKIFR